MFLVNAQEGLFTDVMPIKEFVAEYCDEEFFQNIICDLKACCCILWEKFKSRFAGMNMNEHGNFMGHMFRPTKQKDETFKFKT
jgi:hypothetical protein